VLPKETIALMKRMTSQKLEQLVEVKEPPIAVREITSIALDWIEWQAEKRLTSRKVWEQKI
jgi:hypothetical protein